MPGQDEMGGWDDGTTVPPIPPGGLPLPSTWPDNHGRKAHGGRQMVVRMKRIHGVTPRSVLRHPLYLPVVVGDEFAVGEDSGHTDFVTIGGGEYSHPPAKKGRMLKSFDLSTMSLTWDAHFLAYRGVKPHKLREHLTKILRSEKPVHLIAKLKGARHPEFDGPVTLRSMTARLTAGEPDTRYYDLSFREHRNLSVGKRRHGNAPLPVKHKLHAADTLRGLAFRYYGDGGQWGEIALANGISRWGSEDLLVNMGRYRVGNPITIPEKPEDDPTTLFTPTFGMTDDDADISVAEDV